MSTLYQVMSTINAAVISATNGLMNGPNPVPVASGVGWPPLKILQAIPGGGPQLISVYDRKVGKNATRWQEFRLAEIVTPATLKTVLSTPFVATGASATITLGGTVTPNDAVSAGFINHALIPQQGGAQVAIGGATDTPTTMATKLAAQINADPVLSTWVHAVAAGAVITVTNKTGAGLKILSYTGNQAIETLELGRREREIQITCWAQTETLREIISDPIDVMIAAAENDSWLTTSDGTPIRINARGDFYIEDDTLSDVYRRDFIICAEYPVTTTDILYSVLAPVINYIAVTGTESGL